MKQKQSKLIMGTAIGLAALAVAIDHTRHTLPTPEPQHHMGGAYSDETPCSMDNPCSMENPCGLDSPCSMDNPCSMDSPCSMDNPCSLESESPCGLD